MSSNANLEMHLNENKTNISTEKYQDMIIDYFVLFQRLTITES